MKRFYDKALIETYMKQTKHESIMSGLQEHLFVAQYEKGEFVSMPLQQEHLFQIIIQGSVSIYFIRDDGSVYSLAHSQKGDLLGEMEIFSHQSSNVYAESNDDLTEASDDFPELDRLLLLYTLTYLLLIFE